MTAHTTAAIRRISVDEWHRMAQLGVLRPEERTELVNGQLIQMFPIGFSHNAVQSKLLGQLARQLDERFELWVASTLRIDSHNERYPDVGLVRRGLKDQPGPNDFFLVVEVADTSLSYDLNEKAQDYGDSRVPEYWVIDVRGAQVIVFRQSSQWQPKTFEHGALAVEALPPVVVDIEALFTNHAAAAARNH